MTPDPSEARSRSDTVTVGKSLFDRGLTAGSSGNISVRLAAGGYLMTPTNASLGFLEPESLSKLDGDGRHIAGDPPTKEGALHLAMYRRRPGDGAIVHLHSPYATAVSCLEDLDPTDCLPPLTAYYVMRVGRLPLISYHRPGDPNVVFAIEHIDAKCSALLLANHGPIVGDRTLRQAADAIEELEQTARLALLIGDRRTRPLNPDQIDELINPPQ